MLDTISQSKPSSFFVYSSTPTTPSTPKVFEFGEISDEEKAIRGALFSMQISCSGLVLLIKDLRML